MSAADLTKGDILIVDDNPVNLDLLSNMLLDRKYRVRAATSGKRALNSARSTAPDLIMLDITMPEMDGYEVCRQLKSDERTRDIPVIFISALDEVMDKVRAFEVGGVDYVTKPFQFEEVLARVENQLRISRLQKELERKNAELARKNEELIQSYKRTDQIFSALSDVLPGTVLDEKYRLESKIGAGGFGAVYRAVHLGLSRAVAVKIFRPTESNSNVESLERFRLEGVSACRVNHPNAVAVLDSGITMGGIAYLVMELLEGRTLSQELRALGTLAPRRCAEIIVPVCDVLEKAHRAGIVHRDIKPDNIFIHQIPGGEIVKVVDFGIAKLIGEQAANEPQLKTVGGFLGTPTYMAPERLEERAYDGRADVYSVGIMLYQMLCGRVPFISETGGTWAIGLLHLTQDPPPLREINKKISPEIEYVVMSALAKDPAQRPTAREFADRFAEAVKIAPETLRTSGEMLEAYHQETQKLIDQSTVMMPENTRSDN